MRCFELNRGIRVLHTSLTFQSRAYPGEQSCADLEEDLIASLLLQMSWMSLRTLLFLSNDLFQEPPTYFRHPRARIMWKRPWVEHGLLNLNENMASFERSHRHHPSIKGGHRGTRDSCSRNYSAAETSKLLRLGADVNYSRHESESLT
jgi:hypothetical protein